MLQSNLHPTSTVINQPRRSSEPSSSSTSCFCCVNVRNSPENACSCNRIGLTITCSGVCGLSSGAGVMIGCSAIMGKPAVILGLVIGGFVTLTTSTVCSQLGQYFSQNPDAQTQERLLAPLNDLPPAYDEAISSLNDEESPPSYETALILNKDWLPSYAELFSQAQQETG